MTIGRIPSVEGGIQPTIVDAKGDLIAGVAADSVNRLAVGSNDQVLVADSSTSTGLAWKSYGAQFVAGKNRIINGDFRINQRGFSSSTATSGYMFDRWDRNSSGGTVTYSPQTFTTGTAPVAGYEGTTFLRCVSTSLSGTTDRALTVQRIESVRTFANQTITVSFWAKAASGTPSIAVEFVQYFGSGGSPSSDVLITPQKVSISTSWARYSVTVAIPSISGKTIGTDNNDCLVMNLWFAAGSTFDARTATLGIQNNTFDIWGVQAEAGSVATPFTTATGTIQGELAACQRYYEVVGSGASKPVGMATYTTATQWQAYIRYAVTKRTTPTLSATTGTNYYNIYSAGGANDNFNDITLDIVNEYAAAIYSGTGVSGTAGQGAVLQTNNASASIAFSAEL